jgi:hypothetical protein
MAWNLSSGIFCLVAGFTFGGSSGITLDVTTCALNSKVRAGQWEVGSCMVKFWIEPISRIVTGLTICGEFRFHMSFGRVKLSLMANHTIGSQFLIFPGFMTFDTADVMTFSQRKSAMIKTG